MPHTPKTAILKLDDVKCNSDGALNSAWTRALDICVGRGIHAWAGVIGQYCTNPNAAAVSSVQAYAATGIEFGCHGYSHQIVSLTSPAGTASEFHGTTTDYQLAAMRATKQVVEQKFGVPCKSFGAPGNKVTVETGYAMDASGMKCWFLHKANNSQVLPSWHPNVKYLNLCDVALESTTGVPSLAYLQDEARWNANTENYVVLQAHPASFASEANWTEFAACLDWVTSIGCAFKGPCEYWGV